MKLLRMLVCLVTVGLVPRVVLADPITITAGQLGTAFGGDPTSIQLQGAGLSIDAGVFASSNPGFRAGELGDLNGTFGFGNPTLPTLVLVNDTYFRAFLDGGGTFTTTPFLAPETASGTTFVKFSTPFQFTGSIQGYSTSGRTGAPLFNVDLTGTGRASALTVSSQGAYATVFGVGYTFEDAGGSPTPEPSSLLLLGSSLGGMALYARRRAREIFPRS